MDRINIVAVTALYPPVMAALTATYAVHRLDQATDRAAFLAPLKDKVRGIATFTGTVDAALMDALPRLEIVASMSIGLDHIDLAAAKARGIRVTNTPDVLTDDVADLAIGLMVAVARRLVVADRYARDGSWLKGPMPLQSKLGGATLGVLGMGRIGQAIAKRAVAMGMTIAYHTPRPKPELPYRFYPDLAAMAADVEYLVVAVPGGPATRHLIDARIIAALGPKGSIINIARGSVIDQAALVAALTDRKLVGAGLDVFEDEPSVPEALARLDSVVLTPHVGSATHATRLAMGRLMLDNLAAYFGGKPLLTPVL
ncbi:MAG: 2-hydroxyacid dehydrogenase [Alphaproteobacteria bacterium]|nr:2-hydroxyacid dehydrogenase [Alphaproteobacteria bacterium]